MTNKSNDFQLVLSMFETDLAALRYYAVHAWIIHGAKNSKNRCKNYLKYRGVSLPTFPNTSHSLTYVSHDNTV